MTWIEISEDVHGMLEQPCMWSLSCREVYALQVAIVIVCVRTRIYLYIYFYTYRYSCAHQWHSGHDAFLSCAARRGPYSDEILNLSL